MTSKDVVIRTDRSSYAAERIREGSRPVYAFDAIATFESRSRRMLYLVPCRPEWPGPVYGVGLLDPPDAWGSAYDRIWACTGQEDLIGVSPGATRVDTFQVRGPNSWRFGSDEFFGVLEGEMFLSYKVLTCPDETECLLPDSLRRSNAFEVRLAN